MTDAKKQTSWFRHTASGQTWEAEGEQANLARKDREVTELDGPPESADPDDDLARLRERLTAMNVPWSENGTAEQLQAVLDTEVVAWRAALTNAGVKFQANSKPETLKAKADELAKS